MEGDLHIMPGTLGPYLVWTIVVVAVVLGFVSGSLFTTPEGLAFCQGGDGWDLQRKERGPEDLGEEGFKRYDSRGLWATC